MDCEKKLTHELTKQNKNKLRDRQQTCDYQRERGVQGRINRVKGVKYMVMDGNETFSGKYAIDYIGIEL